MTKANAYAHEGARSNGDSGAQGFESYGYRYRTMKMTRSDGILEVQFHSDDGPLQWDLVAHNELEDAFLRIGRDRDNDVVTLTGTGDTFSGPPIEPGIYPRRGATTPDAYEPVQWEGKHLLPNLLSIEAPVIAAINGPAVRHAEIPLVSDIVLASPDCYFQDSAHFASGLVPGDGMHVVIPLLMGLTRGRYFLLTGQKLSVEEARTVGLVNEVLPREDLLPRARELATKLMKQPRLVRRYTRTLLTEDLRRRLNDVLGYGLALEGLPRM